MPTHPSTDRPFIWERAPFSICANCGRNTFGFLSGGGERIAWRCSACRYSVTEALPAVDKKVIYFDQFGFSELFKLKGGKRREDKLTDFWQELDELLFRAVHLQQIVLPHSDIHHSETLVSPWPQELCRAYEAIGGDLSFDDTRDIEMRQIAEFASAFLESREPAVKLDVDEIIRGRRNDWLPDMRITVNTDYSQFAEGTRRGREESGWSVTDLMEGWRERGLGFDEVLEIELSAYRDSRHAAMRDFLNRVLLTEASGDAMEFLNLSTSLIVREMSILRRMFEAAQIPEAEHDALMNRFWSWERNREMPFGRILTYMFAALAGQVKAGRKKPASPGFMNDVRAIAAYAPFVDAMFLDKECATLLTQGRPGGELKLRAQIFSLTNREEFLSYLRGLEARASDDVRHYAEIIYGVEQVSERSCG
jgi:hypothetical protein